MKVGRKVDRLQETGKEGGREGWTDGQLEGQRNGGLGHSGSSGERTGGGGLEKRKNFMMDCTAAGRNG